jgi:homeobox-leucine zipper protein
MTCSCYLKIDRISGIAAKYVGKPLVSYQPHTSPISNRSSLDLGVGSFSGHSPIGTDMFGPGELLRGVTGQSDADKPLIIELAVTAMEEMVRMAQLNEPLWVHSLNGSTEILNEDEYLRLFPRGIGPKPLGMRSEASRETAVVIMNHANLVQILMDVVHEYFLKEYL